jgi:sensor histidine kinase regulating citrate/malate metabolism
MENLVAADHKELAAKYVGDLRRTVDQASVAIDTANPTLNAVLREYARQAQSLGIRLDMDLGVPGEMAVQPVDLAVIVGNTAENAIAACSKISSESGERAISIRLFKQGGLLFYEIANPLGNDDAQPKAGGGRRVHGYGLQNVRKTVEKYHGHLDARSDGNTYTVTIVLNLAAS